MSFFVFSAFKSLSEIVILELTMKNKKKTTQNIISINGTVKCGFEGRLSTASAWAKQLNEIKIEITKKVVTKNMAIIIEVLFLSRAIKYDR